MAAKGTRCPPKPWSSVAGERSWSPNFEWIGGLLYRKKLERGFLNYREVLDEDRRLEAVATFHRRPPGMCHLSLEETYKCVAENYWWEGMYFHIRDFVLDCPECQSQKHKVTEELGSRGCVTKTIASHGSDMLNKLRSQREAGMFCDITVRTNGQSYVAHRAVLAAVSDHFQEVFTEMDSSMKTDIDLTGFSEDSLLSLLDFSYSSTLCVRWEDLPEVITMARHLGMWPAVEACSALMKEHRNIVHPTQDVKLECGGVCSRRHHQQTETKRKRKLEDNTGGVHLTVDTSDESLEGSPCCNLHKMSNAKIHNRLPMSPSHRMKLMDFKSPSSKKTAVSTNIATTAQSKNYSPTSPPNTRLLRSSPGAAQQVQRLLPILESPQRNRKSCTPGPSPVCSPVRVKREVEEVGVDEEDYARAQEKYKLMLVLGLQRTALLPRPEDLIGWRQKKRLRKLKANNYSLTKRRKPRCAPPVRPYSPVTLSLPLCDPVNSILLDKEGKSKSRGGPPVNEGITKRHNSKKRVPPSDRSMRSKGVLPDMFRAASRPGFSGRELRRSVRNGASVHPPVQQPGRRTSNKTPARNTVRIKSEPAEYSVSGLSLASVNHSSQRTQARNNITGAAVKTLRYNSSRPGTKAKPRQGGTTEERKPRGRPRKVLREEMDIERQAKGDQHDGFQFSEHSPPQAIYNHPLYKVIKEEPPDPVPVGGPLLDPPSPDLGKRQSKPPIKLLDSGFLFSFCRPSGAPMVGIKKEEESVDICLMRSVSQIEEKFGTGQSKHRALRARGPPHTMTMVKREREERSVSQSRVQRRRTNSRNDTPLVRSKGKKAALTIPKQEPIAIPLSSRGCVVLDSVRRARLKQLRGPRSQVPKAPKVAHSCTQCSTSYKDCDALIMHRLRHIEGKHWPCLLCSKTFFRLRNVRNHIRTHDPKLYKCRNCIVAGS